MNLLVTTTVRAGLLAAGAASHGLPTSAFIGLVPGRTYYGRDNRTGVYWAAAALDPSRSSTAAQVSVQDDGAYLIFSRAPGAAWQATNVGLPGDAGLCRAAHLPADVRAVWGWVAGTCHPPISTSSTSPPA